MRPLSAAELVAIYEWGQARPLVECGLRLLETACSELTRDVVASLSIGRRDLRLLTLREWCFGPELGSVAGCPRCGERLEHVFTAGEIRSVESGDPPESLTVKCDGYTVRFRLPNSADLLAIAECLDAENARARLLGRCVLSAISGDEQDVAEPLPAPVVAAIADRMGEADPHGDIRLGLTCPVCGHAWSEVFDILAFFWSEIAVWARRLLHEVHLLASAYGWRESDILSMSSWRRREYLGMVRA
jgi:uncharacterized protein (UPF0212 family)